MNMFDLNVEDLEAFFARCKQQQQEQQQQQQQQLYLQQQQQQHFQQHVHCLATPPGFSTEPVVHAPLEGMSICVTQEDVDALFRHLDTVFSAAASRPQFHPQPQAQPQPQAHAHHQHQQQQQQHFQQAQQYSYQPAAHPVLFRGAASSPLPSECSCAHGVVPLSPSLSARTSATSVHHPHHHHHHQSQHVQQQEFPFASFSEVPATDPRAAARAAARSRFQEEEYVAAQAMAELAPPSRRPSTEYETPALGLSVVVSDVDCLNSPQLSPALSSESEMWFPEQEHHLAVPARARGAGPKRKRYGLRTYTCEVCGFTCKDSGNIVRHRRRHDPQRKYVCSVCGRGFNNSSNYKKHEQRCCASPLPTFPSA